MLHDLVIIIALGIFVLPLQQAHLLAQAGGLAGLHRLLLACRGNLRLQREEWIKKQQLRVSKMKSMKIDTAT